MSAVVALVAVGGAGACSKTSTSTEQGVAAPIGSAPSITPPSSATPTSASAEVADAAPEAAVDAGPDLKTTSFCADLDAWLPPLGTKAADVDDVMPRFKKGNRARKDPIELMRFGGDMSRETAASAKTTRAQQSDLKAHAVLKGETEILTDVVSLYGSFAGVYERYSASFAKGTEGVAGLIELKDVTSGLTKTTRDLDADVRDRCRKLATSAVPSASASGVGATSTTVTATKPKSRCEVQCAKRCAFLVPRDGPCFQGCLPGCAACAPGISNDSDTCDCPAGYVSTGPAGGPYKCTPAGSAAASTSTGGSGS